MTSAQSGFSLLEMVVAVAILGMTLGVLYQATGGATRTLGVDEKSAYAVELARSLRDLYAVVPLGGTSADGRTDGGFSWHVKTTPLDLPLETTLAAGQLQELEIEVQWQDGNAERRFALRSVATGREEAPL